VSCAGESVGTEGGKTFSGGSIITGLRRCPAREAPLWDETIMTITLDRWTSLARGGRAAPDGPANDDAAPDADRRSHPGWRAVGAELPTRAQTTVDRSLRSIEVRRRTRDAPSSEETARRQVANPAKAARLTRKRSEQQPANPSRNGKRADTCDASTRFAGRPPSGGNRSAAHGEMARLFSQGEFSDADSKRLSSGYPAEWTRGHRILSAQRWVLKM